MANVHDFTKLETCEHTTQKTTFISETIKETKEENIRRCRNE